jgi:hypothetical protein
MAKDNEVLLGQKVKCIVTGFEGTVTSITENIFGCRRIGIQPPVGTDGKIPEAMDIDEPQIKVTDKKQVIKVEVPEHTIKLGQKVECTLTGYKGIAYGRCIFLNGCTRYGVQEKYDAKSEKTPCSGKWFYEGQLKVIKEEIKKELDSTRTSTKTGGPIAPSFKPSKGTL